MERRTAIKNLFIIAGGIAILKSCSSDKSKASIQLNKISVSAEQEALLAELVETIIPETTTPGAKSLGLHLFVMKMVDDCHDESDQKKFVDGFVELETASNTTVKTSFLKATKEQRLEVIKVLGATAGSEPRMLDIVKRRTLQGYLNSKYVMTELIPYELIPGRYNGYFPVSKS